MTLDGGTKLGRYEIRSQLGAGGMGEVRITQDKTRKIIHTLRLPQPVVVLDWPCVWRLSANSPDVSTKRL